MEGQPPADVVKKTSGLAIASLVLGILALLCLGVFTAIPAIILGIVALVKINKAAGTQTGQGLAIAGLATGGVGMIFTTAILAAMLVPAMLHGREMARRAACMDNEKHIAVAYLQYAQAHNGQAPQSLDELRKLVGNDQAFHCPGDAVPGPSSYVLVTGDSSGIILREQPGHHSHGGNVAYQDGRVVFQPDSATE